MGEGVEKVLSIIATVVSGNIHYLLIDEIENGLHYSVMTDILENDWKGRPPI